MKRMRFHDSPGRSGRSRDVEPQMEAEVLVATFPPNGQYSTKIDTDGFHVYRTSTFQVQEVTSTTDGAGNKIIGGFGRSPQTPAEINARNRRFWEKQS